MIFKCFYILRDIKMYDIIRDILHDIQMCDNIM